MAEQKSNAVKITAIIAGTIILLGIGGLILAAYMVFLRAEDDASVVEDTTSEKDEVVEQDVTTPEFSGSSFATYEEVSVDIDPQISAYTIEGDLANVQYASDFYFSADEMEKLAENGFVVREGYWDEFFSLYENNRYDKTPNLVTTDSMLHNYHLMFDHILRKLEEDKLIDELKALNAGMLDEALDQYDQLQGTAWENAARRNAGFFAVASVLMDPSVEIPAIVEDEVQAELDLIEAHAGITESPLFNIGAEQGAVSDSPAGTLSIEALKEDYSQYIPRGHYDKTEALKKYFKSMMWYGRLSFQFKNADTTRSALLITYAMEQGENMTHWDNIYEPTNFFVGKSDDVTYTELSSVRDTVFGENAGLETLTDDETTFTTFWEEAKKLDPPKINSIPVFMAAIQEDRDEETLAFRFMGQRYVVDADIFQRLICREVGNKHGTMDCPTEDSRMLPMGLDIPAALGSEEAYEILEGLGETDYESYPENMEKLQDYLTDLDEDTWTQNLYWGWLYALRPLLEEKGEGYPTFMQNMPWVRKQLNTFLGSWTELKHDTILYAKQVYAELGAAFPDEKPDDRGYVEPSPYVYARLASLLRMTNDGLESRGLLTPDNKENLERMEDLALSLKEISEKELNGEALSEDDYELIRSYGGQIEHFWIEVNKEDYEKAGQSADTFLSQNPAAIVADVATDPNGQVLEEATGPINILYAVVPVDGELRVVVGGVYSYFEFPWPLNDRLTDEKWRDLMRSSEAPEAPSWTEAFIAQ